MSDSNWVDRWTMGKKSTGKVYWTRRSEATKNVWGEGGSGVTVQKTESQLEEFSTWLSLAKGVGKRVFPEGGGAS